MRLKGKIDTVEIDFVDKVSNNYDVIDMSNGYDESFDSTEYKNGLMRLRNKLNYGGVLCLYMFDWNPAMKEETDNTYLLSSGDFVMARSVDVARLDTYLKRQTPRNQAYSRLMDSIEELNPSYLQLDNNDLAVLIKR